jgi:hypothetical protein
VRLSEPRRGSGEERTRRCRERLACQPKIETEQSYGITTLGTFCGRCEKSRSLSWLSRQISPTETPNCDTFDQDNADILRKNGVRGVGTIRFFEWRVRADAKDGTAGRTMDHTTESKNKERVLEAFDTLFNKRDYKAAEKFWSPNYIQHSTHIAPGGEGLFDLVKSSFQLSNMKRDWLGYVAGTQPPPRR